MVLWPALEIVSPVSHPRSDSSCRRRDFRHMVQSRVLFIISSNNGKLSEPPNGVMAPVMIVSQLTCSSYEHIEIMPRRCSSFSRCGGRSDLSSIPSYHSCVHPMIWPLRNGDKAQRQMVGTAQWCYGLRSRLYRRYDILAPIVRVGVGISGIGFNLVSCS